MLTWWIGYVISLQTIKSWVTWPWRCTQIGWATVLSFRTYETVWECFTQLYITVSCIWACYRVLGLCGAVEAWGAGTTISGGRAWRWCTYADAYEQIRGSCVLVTGVYKKVMCTLTHVKAFEITSLSHHWNYLCKLLVSCDQEIHVLQQGPFITQRDANKWS